MNVVQNTSFCARECTIDISFVFVPYIDEIPSHFVGGVVHCCGEHFSALLL